MAAITATAKPVGNLATTDYLVAVVDPNVGASKVFSVNTYTASTAAPTLSSTAFVIDAPNRQNASLPKLPKVSSVTSVNAVDPVSGYIYVGQVVVTVTPDSADTVNASSPLTFVFSPNAVAIAGNAAVGT